jgi:hypothetical protein
MACRCNATRAAPEQATTNDLHYVLPGEAIPVPQYGCATTILIQMKEIVYLLIGWVLGLVGPPIVDAIKGHFRKREIIASLIVELDDLRYRLAISSLLLLQKYGSLDKDFLDWIRPILESYSGNEPKDSILRSITGLSSLDETQLGHLAEQLRSREGVGVSLKTFQAKFLEAQRQIPRVDSKENPRVSEHAQRNESRNIEGR